MMLFFLLLLNMERFYHHPKHIGTLPVQPMCFLLASNKCSVSVAVAMHDHA